MTLITFKLGVKPPFLRLVSWIAVVVTQIYPFLPRMIDIPHGKLTKCTFCRLIKGELTTIRQPCPSYSINEKHYIMLDKSFWEFKYLLFHSLNFWYVMQLSHLNVYFELRLILNHFQQNNVSSFFHPLQNVDATKI